MPDPEIQKLTAAMARGDSEAVETFYRRYFDWLHAQARRATRRDESFCLDVVQEAVLRIIRAIRKVDTEIQLRAWLKLVVQTAAMDLLRSERRREKRELVAATSTGLRIDETLDDKQYRWLKGELQRLDQQLVRMIELRYEERWTLARIAKSLGLSIGTIDGRLRRALTKLRHRAIEDFDE